MSSNRPFTKIEEILIEVEDEDLYIKFPEETFVFRQDFINSMLEEFGEAATVAYCLKDAIDRYAKETLDDGHVKTAG